MPRSATPPSPSEAPGTRPPPFEILPQPDDASCGPTCLHAVYHFFGENVGLDEVIGEVASLETGGSLAVQLAVHALRRGYSATIYTYNLDMFDPTWFDREGVDLAERLRAQIRAKGDPKLALATRIYLEFLSLGGSVRFRELNARLIRDHLQRGRPLLTGLSSTYLYGCSREVGLNTLGYDDIRGQPTGHFVVLYGYDGERRHVHIADPLGDNPRFEAHHYSVGIERVIGAILLGVLTYDANLLVLRPDRGHPER